MSAQSINHVFWLLLFCPFFLAASPEEEPLAGQLRETFQKPYLSIGFVLQVVGDFQGERSFPGNNGFNISNMRVVLSGELDKKFGYLLRTNFVSNPTLLDAKLYWQFSDNTRLSAGRFKAPFSKEFLTGAESIDMVNRSQVVSALVPGRQIGMELAASGRIFSVSAGLFNGNSPSENNNDNNDFMIAGRAAVSPMWANGKLEWGLNAAHSNERELSVANSTFSGKRSVFGGDLRIEHDKILLAAEYIYAALDSSGGGGSLRPQGFHATAGFMVAPDNQILVRWDQFDDDSAGDPTSLLILGYNLWPTSMTELQVNYIIDADNGDVENHQLLINAQVAF